jgi:hypothetical protein
MALGRGRRHILGEQLTNRRAVYGAARRTPAVTLELLPQPSGFETTGPIRQPQTDDATVAECEDRGPVGLLDNCPASLPAPLQAVENDDPVLVLHEPIDRTHAEVSPSLHVLTPYLAHRRDPSNFRPGRANDRVYLILDIRIERLDARAEVAANPVLIEAPNDLHVLLRHAAQYLASASTGGTEITATACGDHAGGARLTWMRR